MRNNLGIERIYRSTTKATYDKAQSKHYAQLWKTTTFPSKLRNKTKIPTLDILVNVVLEILARTIRLEKEPKAIQIGKKEVKLFTILR